MDVEKIRTLFEQEIRKTNKRILIYEELAQPISPDNAIGRISRMDAINNKSITDAALRKAKERLLGLKRNSDKLGTQ